MKGQERTLPQGWVPSDLQTVAEVNPTLDKSAYADTLPVSFVPMPSMEAGTGIVHVSKTRPFGEVKKGFTPFIEGDVLFAKITPCMENGKMAVVPAVKNGVGFGSTEFHVLRPYAGIDPRYIYYLVSSQTFRRDAEHKMTGAVGQRRVPTSYLAGRPIWLPPSREQSRIVAKIEELLSELDKGVQNLDTALRQIKVYHQSLLNSAFDGRVTRAFRKRSRDLPSTAELIRRLNQQRQTRYENSLMRWIQATQAKKENRRSGPSQSKPTPPPVIEALTGDQVAGLPELPDGWAWVLLGSLCDVTGGLTKNQEKRKTLTRRMKYLRVANVYSDRLELDEIHDIAVTDDEASKVSLQNGDILVVEGNGSVDQIGRVAMWSGEVPDCGHQNHLIRVRLQVDLSPRFLLQFLLSPVGRQLIMKQASSTSGLHTLSISKVAGLPVPITDSAEGSALLEIVDGELSRVQALRIEIDGQLLRSERLRESVLLKALRGHLVTQDPSDEAASLLLKRIEVSRQASVVVKSKKSRRNGKSAA